MFKEVSNYNQAPKHRCWKSTWVKSYSL